MTMIKYKWTLLLSGFMLALAAVFLLQGGGRPAASEDLSDPFLDPYALSLAHRHAGPGSETEAEKTIRLTPSWPEGKPQAGSPALLAIKISNGEGRPVNEFAVTNEKLMHLIIVSSDLQHFQHVHPEYNGEGAFELPVVFPTSGDYKIYADFQPAGMNELTRSDQMTVLGQPPEPEPLQPSETLTASVEGMKVTLEFEDAPAPQSATSMTYTFTDEETGEPIKDLELYLGAVGHAVAIHESTEHFLHIHPLNWASSGPQAAFGVSFPGSGKYKLWGQFQRRGKTFVVPFVINV
ncbi:hypothetical protein KP806_15850 [Paenibacillus sp. N4]|uniref:hypothetical protein n=1 Tax=Paenibacillus vietnamensis TaxID=2590547 RepID=UPI001CD09946|nr:hypothetical protein [Paenibacillus vietnamensis]MCA0756529.1 hypothetical protein [Paenibacillus vietnamensis]